MNVYIFKDRYLVASVDAKTARGIMAIKLDDYDYLSSKLVEIRKLNKSEINNIRITPEGSEFGSPGVMLQDWLDNKIDLDTEIITDGGFEEL